MAPEDIWLLILFLLLLLLLLLWWWLRWRMRNPAPVPPQGWLLEAGRGQEITDTCGGGDVLYTNLAVELQVSLEVVNGGDCTITYSTGAVPNFLKVLPGARRAAAVTLARGDKISYACQSDASGSHCEFQVRLQRL